MDTKMIFTKLKKRDIFSQEFDFATLVHSILKSFISCFVLLKILNV